MENSELRFSGFCGRYLEKHEQWPDTQGGYSDCWRPALESYVDDSELQAVYWDLIKCFRDEIAHHEPKQFNEASRMALDEFLEAAAEDFTRVVEVAVKCAGLDFASSLEEFITSLNRKGDAYDCRT